jgi:NodT family efflux transporter outer membrane factor (OMF) lipoprotein
MPPTRVEAEVPPQWQAPLPHAGTVTDLSAWWRSQTDATLAGLMEAAQAVSPGVAQALARIEAARANQVQAGSALLPQLSAGLSGQRGISQPSVPVNTTWGAGLQAAWEVDLVGANRTVSQAAAAQVQGTQALWHDARVSVAAEVASVYHAERHCRGQLALQQQEAASRAETARLVQVSTQAGLAAAGDAALARAAAADSAARAQQQALACERLVKTLVALTALPEPALRQQLASASASASPVSAGPAPVIAIPAQTIAQRPDVFAAEREVVVASARVGAAEAQRYPRLTLSGSIGGLQVRSGGNSTTLDTWSIGPLAVNVPLFDGGMRVANVAAAQAQYTQVVSAYKASVRQAVREVEEALLALNSTHTRQAEVDAAAASMARALQAVQHRFDRGLASQLELEEARRQTLATRSAQLALTLERWQAWIALYRASGGGFQPAAT